MVRGVGFSLFLSFFFLFNAGHIPSADCIEAARRKRQIARTQDDYLPLDVSNSHEVSRRRKGGDLESEDESDTENLDFVPKMKTLGQRITEHMGEFVLFLLVVVALFYLCLK